MDIKPIHNDSRLTVLLARHFDALAVLDNVDGPRNVAMHYLMSIHKTKSNREAYVRTRPQTRTD